MNRILFLFLFLLFSSCSTQTLQQSTQTLQQIDAWRLHSWTEPQERNLNNSNTIPHQDYDPEMPQWICSDISNKDETLYLSQMTDMGRIKFAGETFVTDFLLQGLDRRWNWGQDSRRNYDYSIILRSNNRAGYYDFSVDKSFPQKLLDGDRVSPRQMFECKKYISMADAVLSENKDNWRKLRQGMSRDEVTSILGEPETVENNGYEISWQYSEWRIYGTVDFRRP